MSNFSWQGGKVVEVARKLENRHSWGLFCTWAGSPGLDQDGKGRRGQACVSWFNSFVYMTAFWFVFLLLPFFRLSRYLLGGWLSYCMSVSTLKKYTQCCQEETLFLQGYFRAYLAERTKLLAAVNRNGTLMVRSSWCPTMAWGSCKAGMFSPSHWAAWVSSFSYFVFPFLNAGWRHML